MGRSDHARSIWFSVWRQDSSGAVDPDPDLWNHSLPGTCGVCWYSGEKRGFGLNGKLVTKAASEDATEEVQHQKDENEYARPKLSLSISA